MPDDAPDIRILSSTEVTPARRRGRLGRIVWFLLCLLLLGGIGGAIWFWPDPNRAETARRNRAEQIPVLVAAARTADVPVWLDALGTVQAFSTVTIKPMVDGTLVEVLFREGQDVRAGDVLAHIDPRTYQAALDLAEARKAQDEAQLANARADAARYAKLVQNNFATAQQADTARALVAQLEAQVRQDQAQIDSAQTQLSFTTITAPNDGRTGIRLVDQGNIVHASDPAGLVVITTLQPIAVVFTLPQQNLPAVAAAMRAGKPEALAMAQAADQVIKLKARFPNADRQLWPGGFVGVRLRVDTLRDAVTVPPAAVQRGPRGMFAYVKNADNTVSRRPVTAGYEDQGVSVITAGIKPGEQVVTDGTARLNDGAKVNVVEPDPATTGPAAAAPPGARRRAPAATQ